MGMLAITGGSKTIEKAEVAEFFRTLDTPEI